MDNKNSSAQFDINKICRACLSEKGEMRSVFLADETIGQAMRLADMIMGFSTVQVNIYKHYLLYIFTGIPSSLTDYRCK